MATTVEDAAEAGADESPAVSLGTARRAVPRPPRLAIFGRLLIAVATLAGIVTVVTLAVPVRIADRLVFGVTFSPRYATSLGLDPQATFSRLLEDLPLQEIRLPVYWDEVEAVAGEYDLSAADWYIEEAAAHGRTVIPVLGYKVPRWPECHPPGWAVGRTVEEKRRAILGLLRAEVGHLRRHSNLGAWQVENEPFFPFGECDGFTVLSESFVVEEVRLVRRLDTRPVLITDSGEWSSWMRAMRSGDRFGSSLYRSFWFEHVGVVSYPFPPSLYAAKDRLARFVTGSAGERVVIELQAEPWFISGGAIVDVPLDRQVAMFSPSNLLDNVTYAQRTGASTVHLWGAEWWYWMAGQGHPDYLHAARRLMAEVGRPGTEPPDPATGR